MKSKKNDFELVKEHINFINNRSWKISFLDTIHVPEMVKDRDEWMIGGSSFVDEANFDQRIQKILDEETYFIIFNDGGIIHLAYSFDSNGSIKKHTLFFANMFDSSVYLRLDYSSNEEKHNKSHMHTSLKHSNSSYEFRIPVNSPVFPRSFLLFILTNYYSFDCAKIDDYKDIKTDLLSKVEKLDIPHLKLY